MAGDETFMLDQHRVEPVLVLQLKHDLLQFLLAGCDMTSASKSITDGVVASDT